MTLQPHHSGATETRRMGNRARTDQPANMSNKRFGIALIVIIVALALFAFLLWL